MVEFPQIQPGQLLDLFQTIDQRIAMDKELSGSFGDLPQAVRPPQYAGLSAGEDQEAHRAGSPGI